MEDPYWRDNENEALELMKNDFEYRGSFDIDIDGLAGADEALLRFNGLDTIADITLNGKPLGSVNNMHRVWEYPVKDLIREQGNELVIIFSSPVKYIEEQFRKDPAILGSEDAMRGFPGIRKGHYMFGWDWGPRLPDAGLYDNYVSYQLIEKGGIISAGTVLFCPPKHFKFIDPGLKIRLEGDEIAVSAAAYAKSVEIRNENDDLILSDNFFDLNGDERRIKILKGDPRGLSVRSVYNIGCG